MLAGSDHDQLTRAITACALAAKLRLSIQAAHLAYVAGIHR